MAARKQSAKKPAVAEAPKPTAAAKEKDKEEPAAAYRVDLGESIPAQAPPPTATDKHA